MYLSESPAVCEQEKLKQVAHQPELLYPQVLTFSSRGLLLRLILAAGLFMAACGRSPESASVSTQTPAESAAKIKNIGAVYMAVPVDSFQKQESRAQAKFQSGFGNAIEYGFIVPRDATGWVAGYSDPAFIPPIQNQKTTYAKMSPARFLRFTMEQAEFFGCTLESDKTLVAPLHKEKIPAVLRELTAADAGAPIELYRESAGGPPDLLFTESVPEPAP